MSSIRSAGVQRTSAGAGARRRSGAYPYPATTSVTSSARATHRVLKATQSLPRRSAPKQAPPVDQRQTGAGRERPPIRQRPRFSSAFLRRVATKSWSAAPAMAPQTTKALLQASIRPPHSVTTRGLASASAAVFVTLLTTPPRRDGSFGPPGPRTSSRACVGCPV